MFSLIDGVKGIKDRIIRAVVQFPLNAKNNGLIIRVIDIISTDALLYIVFLSFYSKFYRVRLVAK